VTAAVFCRRTYDKHPKVYSEVYYTLVLEYYYIGSIVVLLR
jgi:hypothetical protein